MSVWTPHMYTLYWTLYTTLYCTLHWTLYCTLKYTQTSKRLAELTYSLKNFPPPCPPLTSCSTILCIKDYTFHCTTYTLNHTLHWTLYCTLYFYYTLHKRKSVLLSWPNLIGTLFFLSVVHYCWTLYSTMYCTLYCVLYFTPYFTLYCTL